MMTKLRTGAFYCALAVVLFLSAGCQHTFEEKEGTKVGTAPALLSVVRIYIARPFDATFKEKVAHNSGAYIAEALLVAFNRNTKFAAMSRRPQSAPEALLAAKDWNAEYMVYPAISKWEDRSTEMSGIRDKLSFRLDLYEVETGKVVHSHEVDAKSRWMTDGGDSPADMLQAPIDQWVQTLFSSRIEKPNLQY